MYWSVILKPNKYVTCRTSNVLHISQSALDLRSIRNDENEGYVQVWIKAGTSQNLVATLNKNIPQVRLDLAFAKNEVLLFCAKGTGIVHLTGYYIALEDQGENQQSSIERGVFDASFNDGDVNAMMETANDSSSTAKSLLDDLSGNESDEFDFTSSPKNRSKVKQSKAAQSSGTIKSAATSKTTNKIDKKTVGGGVKIENLIDGTGKAARNGQRVSIRIEGRLQLNNKVFMSNIEHEFVLGSKDIGTIDGWHYGIVGMKVGSKQRLSCPPNAAYGSAGLIPFVPGNSNVVFDIELLKIQKN